MENKLNERQEKRFVWLSQLRKSVVPVKKRLLEELEYMEYHCDTMTLSEFIVVNVFKNKYFECAQPSDYSSMTAEERDSFNTAKKAYRSRLIKLTELTYNELDDAEKRQYQTYKDYLIAYIDMVNDEQRDIEVAFDLPHPQRPSDTMKWDNFAIIEPNIYTSHDISINRQNEMFVEIKKLKEKLKRINEFKLKINRKPISFTVFHPDLAFLDNNESDDELNKNLIEKYDLVVLFIHHMNNEQICWSCLESHALESERRNGQTVCTKCGYVVESAFIDDTITSLPYNHGGLHAQTKTVYEVTQNFMKHIGFLCGETQNLPPDIFEYVRTTANQKYNKHVNYKIVRDILKSKKQYSKFYPQIPAILHKVAGIEPIRLTMEQRNLLENMHVVFTKCYKQCPESIRQKRKSSINNNHLAYKFFQMLGLNEYLKGIRLPDGIKVIKQNDEILKWVVNNAVDLVPEAKQMAHLWKWHPSPLLGNN